MSFSPFETPVAASEPIRPTKQVLKEKLDLQDRQFFLENRFHKKTKFSLIYENAWASKDPDIMRAIVCAILRNGKILPPAFLKMIFSRPQHIRVAKKLLVRDINYIKIHFKHTWASLQPVLLCELAKQTKLVDITDVDENQWWLRVVLSHEKYKKVLAKLVCRNCNIFRKTIEIFGDIGAMPFWAYETILENCRLAFSGYSEILIGQRFDFSSHRQKISDLSLVNTGMFVKVKNLKDSATLSFGENSIGCLAKHLSTRYTWIYPKKYGRVFQKDMTIMDCKKYFKGDYEKSEFVKKRLAQGNLDIADMFVFRFSQPVLIDFTLRMPWQVDADRIILFIILPLHKLQLPMHIYFLIAQHCGIPYYDFDEHYYILRASHLLKSCKNVLEARRNTDNVKECEPPSKRMKIV